MNRFGKGLCGILGGLMLLHAAAAFPAFADDDNTFTDNTLTYEKIEGGVRIVSAESGTVKIVIPAQIDGYPILEIGDQAFSNCSNLTDVQIYKGVRKIGAGAFSYCMNLKSITIPETVTSIGEGAFYYCGSLTELTVPDSVTEIGGSAFANCFQLTQISLPDTIKEIPAYCFYYDVALESLTLPAELETVGSMSFVACYALRDLTFPASVTAIEPAAVVACPGITAFTVAEGNPAYCTDENGVLYDIDRKTLMCYPAGSAANVFEVPASVTKISDYACSGALNLVRVELPDSVTEIGKGVFSDCNALETFEFPASFTMIPESMFANASLKAFTIPETVQQIGAYAFFGCEELTEITIPETVTAIGDEAFFGCTNLPVISVPDSVTQIGLYTFGFYLPDDAEDQNTPLKQEGFTLMGGPRSAAKTYAKENEIAFNQIGVDSRVIVWVIIGALAILFIILTVLTIRRAKKHHAEQEAAEMQETAEELDPNYQSIILEDPDEGDPFERSYGILPEDDSADSE